MKSLRHMSSDELLVAYRDAAVVHGQASEEGDARRGNAAYDRLVRIRRLLREAGPEHARAILTLLDDEDRAVRVAAAADALELSPEDGLRVLREVASGPRGHGALGRGDGAQGMGGRAMEAALVIRLLALVMTLAACESRTARDVERHKETLREFDQWNRVKGMNREPPPPISARDAVGCDVCPDQCRWMDLRSSAPLPLLLREYRHAASRYGINPGDGGDTTVRDVADRAACIIRRGDSSMHEALLELLDDEDAGVRYCAAIHALKHGLATDKPLAVLHALAEREAEGGLPLMAAIRVLHWEAGIPLEL